jgi:hypothetical protein
MCPTTYAYLYNFTVSTTTLATYQITLGIENEK